jgi:hypothetical protein
MNKKYILFHLNEAHEALQKMIRDLESDVDYESGNFFVDISHLYHHVNTSWNAQYISSHEASNQTDDEFYEWRQFPDNIDLGRS